MNNNMLSLLSASKAQISIANHVRDRRVGLGLTQEGLAIRAGVPLPTLRRFEQQGLISLEAFLKLLSIVGGIDEVVKALEPQTTEFSSIDEVLREDAKPKRKKGWRK